jgi:hypothetical protein
MADHAILSPSGAHRWLNCPGSVAMEQGRADEPTEFKAEGTAAHEIAALCLTSQTDAAAYIGRIVKADGFDIEITDGMADDIQLYVDAVRDYAVGHDLMVEQRVPIGHITGEAGAEGTSDAIIVTADGNELIVIDLKFGRGVTVSAIENDQGRLYALGALELVTLLGYAPKHIRIVIHQPRILTAPSEWDCTVAELQQFAQRATERASHALSVLRNEKPGAYVHHLRPGDEQCKFCKAKADCPKLVQLVADTTLADFDDATQTELIVETAPDLLARCLAKVDLIEDWCAAIRKKAHNDLANGIDVPGFKLVTGKKGNRAWADKQAAEAAMKSMRLKQDEMYTYKVISPTVAEKLLKDTPRRWSTLQKLITQAEGKPTVAPASDPRQPLVIKPTADEFEDVSTETCADLC